ncbi:MAG: OstA-like protein [Ignavibacteriaceae bacterium]
MIIKKIKFFFIIFIFTGISFAQQQIITVTGGKDVFHNINGESIDTVYGNVVITQGNVVITCDKAVRFISENKAELIGNVVAKQDTITITTDHGYYFGNERKAESNSGVKLDDKKVILTADTGDYFFDLDKAIFKSKVKLYDTASTLTSNKLTYFKDEGKAIAVGNVKIIQKKNIIEADSLTHFRESGITFAYDNVKISNTSNSAKIYGDHLEDYPKKFYSLIDKNPLLIQIDSSYFFQKDTSSRNGKDSVKTLKIDTLLIKSSRMESYRDTINVFKAEDSVEIVRGNFASKNDYSEYFRSQGKIVTDKINDKAAQPIIWYDNSQLTGDSVTIFMKDNKINLLDVNRNAFILSQNIKYPNRFDQISGDKFIIHFDDNGINQTEVYGKVYSIYYLYDDNTPNGLVKSSSQTAKIFFEDKKVSQVNLYGTPNSEYYPEVKVKGNELSFTLPDYVFYNNRPTKEKLLSGLEKSKVKIKN